LLIFGLFFRWPPPEKFYADALACRIGLGATFSNDKNRLRVLQNNAVRTIFGGNQTEHISSSHLRSNILKLDDLSNFEKVKLMFLYSKRLLLKPLQKCFVGFKLIRTCTDVEQSNHCIPNYNTMKLQRTFNKGAKGFERSFTNYKTVTFQKA